MQVRLGPSFQIRAKILSAVRLGGAGTFDGTKMFGFRVWLYTPPRIRKAEVVLTLGRDPRMWVRPLSVGTPRVRGAHASLLGVGDTGV